MVQLLLAQPGIDASKAMQFNKRTAIHIACDFRDALSEVLIAHRGIDLDARDKWGSVILACPVSTGTPFPPVGKEPCDWLLSPLQKIMIY